VSRSWSTARAELSTHGHNANGSFFLDPEIGRRVDVVRGPTAHVDAPAFAGRRVADWLGAERDHARRSRRSRNVRVGPRTTSTPPTSSGSRKKEPLALWPVR